MPAFPFILSLWILFGCSVRQRDDALDRGAQRELVEALAARLKAAYVSADAAQSAARRIGSQLDAGAYAGLGRSELASKLTLDLQLATHDKHLRVSPAAEPPPLQDDRHPRVFGRVERVGDVAYVEVSSFGVLPERARGEVASTMSSVADAQALVLDLSLNGGGHPDTVALVASYLFGDEPIHLNTMLERASGVRQESFTDPHVAGNKLGPRKPVFVIIGPRTFSGAEEFTYDLQALRRVTVVGERSGGGAHAGGFEVLPHGFSAFVPSRRPINPVTHANWEGVGVTPDVRATAKEARAVAMRLAAESVQPRQSENDH
jgi:C-terminal processing protease CtpA/Prc